MLPKFKKAIIFFVVLFGLLSAKAYFPAETKAQIAPDQLQCLGEALAEYMNAVIDGAGGLSHIRLISPTFNMTADMGSLTGPMIQAAVSAGGNFNALHAISGNSYNVGGGSVTGFVTNFMNYMPLPDKPVILCETGNYNGVNGVDYTYQQLATELGRIQSRRFDGVNYLGALLFSAFGTNDEFGSFNMTDTDIRIACNGACGNIGINAAASFYQQDNFYGRANGLDMGYVLEIAGTVDSVTTGIAKAQANGLTTIIRIGTLGGSGGFDDPATYVNLLTQVNNYLASNNLAPVLAIAGPNEPISEHWYAPECVVGLTGFICDPTDAQYAEEYMGEYGVWHTLRPYPLCPWYPPATDLNYYMCGHDLVTAERFRIPFEQRYSYYTGIDDIYLISCEMEEFDTYYLWNCSFEARERGIDISAYVDELDFPVMGLTEPDYVANIAAQSVDSVEPEQLMNEYVSWYMNGVTGRGEYSYPQRDEEGRLTSDENFDYRRMAIDQAGPLRKQLPWRIQIGERIDQVNSAGESRHDQVVGCIWSLLGGGRTPDACIGGYRMTGSINLGVLGEFRLGSVDSLKLSYWDDNEKQPPFDEDYIDNEGDFDFESYWRAYLNWRGQDCLDLFGDLYYCFDSPFSLNYTADMFYLIPFTSTEDLTGLAWTDPALTTQPPSDIALSSVTFVPDPSEANPADGVDRYLYFPHMEEGAELAQLDQTTFVPYDERQRWLTDSGYYSEPNDMRAYIYNTDYCELLDEEINPGDRLQHDENGGINARDDQFGIKGELTYSGTFECEWRDPKPICGDPAFAFDGQTHCNLSECVPYTCTTDGWVRAGDVGSEPCSIPYDPWVGEFIGCESHSSYSKPPVPDCEITARVATSMYDAVPKIQEVFDRYVNGDMSIFKRIYPKIGEEGSVLREIVDLPVKSHYLANYTSGGYETLAGNPSLNRPGNRAEFFWPHLGSVYYYFIKGVQYAYRPRALITYVRPSTGQVDLGYNINPPPSAVANPFESIDCPTSIPSLASPGSGIICSVDDFCTTPDSAVPSEWLGQIKITAIDLARRWVSTGGENSNISNCYNDTVVRSLSAGINPIYSLAIWIQESDASNYDSNVTMCDPAYPSRTVQDFGINNLNFPGNYDAQIKQWLRLPYVYPVNYPQCFTDGCNLATFSRVYQQGVSADCSLNSAAIAYATKTLNTMRLIWPACQPLYPTDLSCSP